MRKRTLLGLLTILSGTALPATAQCVTETVKLLAGDAQANDQFGGAVATDGTTLVIGAEQDDDRGDGAGAAYVYEQVGGAWTQAAKLRASDGDSGDNFGHAVAVSGDTILVGAYQDEEKGATAGAVYVFRRVGGFWSETQKLLASDGGPGDRFGSAVSLDGGLAVVGASTDDGVAPDSGSAYVFEYLAGTWVQQVRLDADDGQNSDQAGAAVLVRGETALVGSLFADGVAANSGAVYVHQRESGTWAQTAKITASDGEPLARFGRAISFDGSTLVVGARDASGGGIAAGAAYSFEPSAGTWNETGILTLPVPQDEAGFGSSVAVQGGLVVVGAYRADSGGLNSGAARLFIRVGGVWTDAGELLGATTAAGEQFGWAAALAGTTLAIGAPFDDDADVSAGSVYVFAASEAPCCEPCDTNCDGSLNGFDIGVFIDALSGIPSNCSPCASDTSGDGSVNGFDIAGFIACLSGP